MRVFGLKACDTCRAAVKALTAAGRDVTLVDVRADPLAVEDIARFEAAFGDALINRRSTTWRQMSDEARGLPAVQMLAEHPSVMKRPVIEGADGALHLGWSADVKAALGV